MRPKALRSGASLLAAAGGLALVAGLGACSRPAAAGTGLAPPPGVPVEDNFGSGFGQAFRASPDAAPINPGPGAAVPVDPNGQPIQVR